MVIQVYVLTSNTAEAEVEWFYEELQELLELTPPKNVHLQLFSVTGQGIDLDYHDIE